VLADAIDGKHAGLWLRREKQFAGH
jgi:hypothetical protein